MGMTLTHPRSTLSFPHFRMRSKAGTGAGVMFSGSSSALKADRMAALAGTANLTRYTPICWLTSAPHQPGGQQFPIITIRVSQDPTIPEVQGCWTDHSWHSPPLFGGP